MVYAVTSTGNIVILEARQVASAVMVQCPKCEDMVHFSKNEFVHENCKIIFHRIRGNDNEQRLPQYLPQAA
jgi:hypothetical protein